MTNDDEHFPALIYAAGFGTRMRQLTKDVPKPLITVGGKTLLDHAFDVLDSPRISKKIVNLHYLKDQIKNELTDRDVYYSDETDALLETGGAIQNALPLFDSSTIVTLNSDAVWRGAEPLESLLNAWDSKFEALLLLVPIDKAIGHTGTGDFDLNQNNTISRGTEFVYTGLQATKTTRYAGVSQRVFSSNIVWDKMIESGGAHGVIYDGLWCDVGQPESIPLADSLLSDSFLDV